MTTAARELEQAAVDLAANGYHVFPCRPGDKRPMTANGFKDATRDERKILQWWDRTPDANIGIACGASGIVVLDIDAKHGADPDSILNGRSTAGAPVILTGEAPERDASHPHSLTGVRGAQVYFQGKIPTTALTVDGVELRGVGAYVVAPPSIHPSGVAYEGRPRPVKQLPPIPAWVTDLVPSRNGHARIEAVTDRIPKGEQHRTLVSLAGSMRRRGMNADEIEAALQVTNRTRLEDPAPAADIRRIAESVAKYPPGEAVNGTMSVRMAPDAEAAAQALGELLALPSVGLRIRAARVYGKGSGASLEVDITNGETMTFVTLREMMRPQTLIAEVAACTGATPAIKQQQCAQALTLARVVAEYVETDTENDIAYEWGRDFLQLAETLDLDITDQAQRWRAFELLAARDPWGARREAGDDAGMPLVLRHEDGARYVRTVWFERYVKTRDASVSRTAIGPRMARVGWGRRGKQGDIKATAIGRRETKTFPFWVVPNGWEDTP